MDTIIAVYEKGVLRPLSDLELAEHTHVRLQILEKITGEETAHPLLALANLGESPEVDVSERAEEILKSEIKPESGWSGSDADSG